MEHAKKFLLIDPARASSAVTAAQLYRPTISDKKLGRLDGEISEILKSDVPDDIKAKRYMQAVKSYRQVDNNNNNKSKINRVDNDEAILQTVPQQARTSAKHLLQHIKPNVTWSDKGEIVKGDSVIPYSDIANLLTDSVSTGLAAKRLPIGWEEFVDTLKEARAPYELTSRGRFSKRLKPDNMQPDVPDVFDDPIKAADISKEPTFRERLPSRLRPRKKLFPGFSWDDLDV